MKPTQAKEKPEKLYSYKEAAGFLDVSERRVFDYVKQSNGLIQPITEKRTGQDGKTRNVSVLRESDLKKIQDAKEQLKKARRGEINPDTSQALTITKKAALVPVLAELPETKPKVDIKDKLFLSLSDAVAFSGLPESFLLELIHDKKVKAIKRHKWLIWREDLEQLPKRLFK